ncbi:MAG: hypothetical protein O7G85_14005 [Planctomycetota bacterium]|nr:hypothetical protein [Planctomycetota bacterium]
MSEPRTTLLGAALMTLLMTSGAPGTPGTPGSPGSTPGSTPVKNSVSDSDSILEIKDRYGAELASDDASLTSVYIIPMQGQMGTDIHTSIYREVIEEINDARPDLVVWALNCADSDPEFGTQDDPTETGRIDLDHYRDLVNMLQDDPRLQDVRQVMWVHDSEGISSVVAMAWPEMYMAPGARLQGLQQLYDGIDDNVSDADVRAKFLAGVIAMSNGFLQMGGHPTHLGEAMINPEHRLAATWHGREVWWTLNGEGDYLIDQSEDETATFNSKTAEDFGISDGTAETLDDLLLLLGYREYRLIDGRAERKLEEYQANWRRAYEQSLAALIDYNTHLGWAGGSGRGGGGIGGAGGVGRGGGAGRGSGRGGSRTSAAQSRIKYLSMARNDLKKVVAAMKRYEAVEYRLALQGTQLVPTELNIERLTERLRLLREAEKDSRGNGRGDGRGR